MQARARVLEAELEDLDDARRSTQDRHEKDVAVAAVPETLLRGDLKVIALQNGEVVGRWRRKSGLGEQLREGMVWATGAAIVSPQNTGYMAIRAYLLLPNVELRQFNAFHALGSDVFGSTSTVAITPAHCISLHIAINGKTVSREKINQYIVRRTVRGIRNLHLNTTQTPAGLMN